MTAIMTTPVATGRSGWQPGHIPRLSYRNPVPPGEELQQINTTAGSPATKPSNGPGLSIREIREALPRESFAPADRLQVLPPSVQPQKTKKSFLGAIFAKEPSMAALDQVSQQMMAQHGSISPTAIPHVSSQRMPHHVPKVNSKWDGVPEYIKMREKQERDRAKGDYGNPLRPLNSRSPSKDLYDDQSVIRRRNSNAASTVDTWDSRSTDSRPAFLDGSEMRPGSVYSSSSGSSTNPAQRPASGTSHSYSSLSGTKSPDTSVFDLDETAPSSKAQQRPSKPQNILTQSMSSSEQSRHDRSPRIKAPSVDAIPEYTSSSATTPLERSPQTPFSDDDISLDALIRNETILPGPVVTRTSDAKPKATRKNSTRAGLGLRTNSSIAPWESQTLPSEITNTPTSGISLSSRGKGRYFGKEKR